MRVLLCEQYQLVRHGIRLLLDATPDLGVCRHAASPTQLHGEPGTPDVVISELVFPDLEGPPVVRALRARFPHAALLVLSRLANPMYVHLTLGAGANGYVLKTAEPDELLAAVRHVARGEECVHLPEARAQEPRRARAIRLRAPVGVTRETKTRRCRREPGTMEEVARCVSTTGACIPPPFTL